MRISFCMYEKFECYVWWKMICMCLSEWDIYLVICTVIYTDMYSGIFLRRLISHVPTIIVFNEIKKLYFYFSANFMNLCLLYLSWYFIYMSSFFMKMCSIISALLNSEIFQAIGLHEVCWWYLEDNFGV